MSQEQVKRLSSTVLELKFMKRTKEKVMRQEKEEPLLYADQLSALDNSTDKVVLLGSHYDVTTYLPCRLSFGGMEPNIEKLNADKLTGLYEVIKEEEEEEEEEGVDVTKEEMASHFSSLNETVAQKFNKKSKKRKSDDLPKNAKGRKLFKNMSRDEEFKQEN
ncbi:hypothetical protein Avbf_04852 [Armadillidium vulgare]|nr:hypothetical protein Avbf_04852 [Armadillidium vulgare]